MISVSSIQEIYDFIDVQQCNCGDLYYIQKIALELDEETWYDVALVKCQACGKEKEFRFDITQIFQDYPSGFDLQGWEIPVAGQDNLYTVNEKSYSNEVKKLITNIEENDISADEKFDYFESARDQYYPKIIGRYQVFRYRKGGMGTNYLCVDNEWSKGLARSYFVVCKTVNLEDNIEYNSEKIQAIIIERDFSLAIGSHANLVEIFDVIEFSPSRFYIIMEFIPNLYEEGTTVAEWLRGGAIDKTSALKFACDICNAMIFCNEKLSGFGHGDLKPDNLFVGPGKNIKIGDFGLASANYKPGLKLGASLGTPEYLAPEYNGTQNANQSGDVYSFGVILLEMLTGDHPFKHFKNREEIRMTQRLGKINLASVTDLWLQELLKNCLALNPSERPTFGDILSTLIANGVVCVDQSNTKQRQSDNHNADLNNKALRLISRGEFSTSINILRRIIRLDSDNFIVKKNLAYGLSKSGKYQEAETIYKELINSIEEDEQTELSAQIFSNYAAHLLRHKKGASAIEAILACDKALRIEKNHFPALINKGVALNTIGEPNKALDVLESARQIDPRNVVLLYEMAFANFKIFEVQNKERFLEKSLQILNDLIKVDFNFAPSYNLYNYIITRVPVKNRKIVRKFLNKLNQNFMEVKVLHNKLDNLT